MHELPWQAEVCRALSQTRAAQVTTEDQADAKRPLAAAKPPLSDRLGWRS